MTATSREPTSGTFPFHRAATSPSGIPTASASSIEIVTSSIEAGARRPMSSSTGRRVRSETPQSPVATPPTYSAIWTGIGRSSPSSSRAFSICSGRARGPAHVDCRIARHDAGDDEREHDDAQDDQRGERQPPDDEARHAAGVSS